MGLGLGLLEMGEWKAEVEGGWRKGVGKVLVGWLVGRLLGFNSGGGAWHGNWEEL